MDLSAKKRTLYLDVARVAAIVSISLNHATAPFKTIRASRRSSWPSLWQARW